MDEFGVLVESIGFRAQGKSAPMAKSKPKPKSQFTTHSHTTAKTSSFDDHYSLPVDQLDGIFRSNVSTGRTPPQSQNLFIDEDIFGGTVSSSQQFGGVDLETVLSGSNARKSSSTIPVSKSSLGFDDLLGLKPKPLGSRNSSSSGSKSAVGFDDLLGSNNKPIGSVDDLFGNLGLNSNSKLEKEKKGPGVDELIPTFEGESASNTKVFSETKSFPASNVRVSNSSSSVIDDPFLVFESSVSQSSASWPFDGPTNQDSGKGSVQSSVDDFDDFISGGTKSKVDGISSTANKPISGTSLNGFGNRNFVDDIFGGSDPVQQNNASRPSSMAQNSLFGDFFNEEKKPEAKRVPTQPKVSTKKAFSTANTGNDYSSLFEDITTSAGEFYEIEGEPEERRRARLNRYMRMNERMAEALALKNQRDLEIQFEQDEKRRFAEVLENDIKRWAAGKEGNIRALLSSLQQILWPECGWRQVSLTDMITSDSVKKVYKKAALYVHPDKVQQKGATPQQKYIAEKVFDLLKEAWNKFSAEELR